MEQPKQFVGAGGTTGGVGHFFLGFAMACAGGWLLLNQVTVTSGFFAMGWVVPFVGYQLSPFGLVLVPFIFGIGMLFFNGRSMLGWLLTIASVAMMLAAILMSLHIYFRPTSLFNTLTMLVLLFGGLGLVFRSFRDFEKATAEPANAHTVTADRTP